jgi:hypothetical protein
MSAGVLIVLGVVLCFLGTLSLRVAVLVAGFGLGWLLAGAFGAGTSTQLLVAAVTAGAGLVASVLLSKSVLFIGGAFVGAVIGARVFVLVNAGSQDGHGDWVLAVVFVPAVALVCGFLANRVGKRFLAWGTAAAGAALICSGIGRIGHWSTDAIWRPDSTVSAVIVAVLWLGLTVAGHRVQTRGRHPASV